MLQDLLTTKALAARWKVSDQTVLNYVKRGMPSEGEGADGKLFDAALCDAWRTDNIHGIGRGGKRQGAGRTPATPEVAKNAQAGAGAERPADPSLWTDKQRQEEILKALGGGDNIFAIVERYGITPALAKTLNELLIAQGRQIELWKSAGDLLAKADVKQAWATIFAEIDAALNALPMGVAAELAAELAFLADHRERLREKLAVRVEALRALLRSRDARGMTGVAGMVGATV